MGDGQIIGARIGAGEIKVDQAGDFAVEDQHIVRKEISMDGRCWQIFRPIAFQIVAFLPQFAAERPGCSVSTISQIAFFEQAVASWPRPSGLGRDSVKSASAACISPSAASDFRRQRRIGIRNRNARKEIRSSSPCALQYPATMRPRRSSIKRGTRQPLMCRCAKHIVEIRQIRRIDAVFIQRQDEA